MGSGLVFFAAVWRGLFFLGYGRFELRLLLGKPAAIALGIDWPCTPSLSARDNFSAKPGICV
jgi:hypothetical protein